MEWFSTILKPWHQVRPGEVRNNCGGCHGHSQQPLDFSQTAAAKFDYVIPDLANETPIVTKAEENKEPILKTVDIGAVDMEYYRDIKPILQRSCVQCHSLNGRQEAQLVLDDEEEVGGFENTYNRLAKDSKGDYGIPPLVSSWRQNQSVPVYSRFPITPEFTHLENFRAAARWMDK